MPDSTEVDEPEQEESSDMESYDQEQETLRALPHFGIPRGRFPSVEALRISGVEHAFTGELLEAHFPNLERLRIDTPLWRGRGTDWAATWGDTLLDLWVTHADGVAAWTIRHTRAVLSDGTFSRLRRFFYDGLTQDGRCPPELVDVLREHGVRWEPWPFPDVPATGRVQFTPPLPSPEPSPHTLPTPSRYERLLRDHDEVSAVLRIGRRRPRPDPQAPDVDRVELLEALDDAPDEDEWVLQHDDEVQADLRGWVDDDEVDRARETHDDLRGGGPPDGWFEPRDAV